MQKNLSIGFENFRVFNEMTEFEFAPITILTGANSSGKSTVIKGIMMMEQFFKPRKNNIGSWDIPLLDFSKNLKGLGSFTNIINNPENDYVIVKLNNHHIYFGNYQLVLKIGKNGNTTGRLNHFSIIMENIDEPIVEFKYDVSADENNESNWYCKANQVWLLNSAKRLFSEVKQGAEMNQIYEDHLKKFEEIYEREIYGEEYYIPEMKMFSPEITEKFFEILKEKDFDFLNFESLRTKTFFLESLEFEVNKSYYKHWSDPDKKITDILSLDEWGVQVIKSLGESYNAFDLYNKLIELSPDLVNEEDLLKDCEEAVSEGSLTINDCKKVDEILLQISSERYIEAGAQSMINYIEIPDAWRYILGSVVRGKDQDALKILISNLGIPLTLIYVKTNYFFSRYRYDITIGNKDTKKYQQAQTNFRNLEQFSSVLFYELLNETSKHFAHIEYIEANRAEAKRSFNFQSDASSFNLFIRDFCENVSSYYWILVKLEDKLKFVNDWLKEFEIADEMKIEINDDGDAAKIFLVKGDIKRNIADLGYGTTQLLPMLMYVAHFAVNNGASPDRGGITLDGVHHWSTVGGGMDQYSGDIYPYTICIEEPETNLHPMMQAKLADFFVFCTKKLNINFIIETHSEALIRKLQYLTAKGDISPQESIIYYIGNPNPGKREVDEEQVRKIEIKRNGQLSKPFGSGFTDEATKWIKEMFTYSNSN